MARRGRRFGSGAGGVHYGDPEGAYGGHTAIATPHVTGHHDHTTGGPAGERAPEGHTPHAQITQRARAIHSEMQGRSEDFHMEHPHGHLAMAEAHREAQDRAHASGHAEAARHHASMAQHHAGQAKALQSGARGGTFTVTAGGHKDYHKRG